MKTIIKNTNIVLPDEILTDGAVGIDEQGKITFVGPSQELTTQVDEIIDLQGMYLAPGLIDLHDHGGFGVAFDGSDDLADDLVKYSNWAATTGLTGFLTSIAAPSTEKLVMLIKSLVVEFEKGLPGAQALGIHLEGPYLSPQQKGAQSLDWLRTPSIEEAKKVLDAAQGWIKQITLAPELPNADEVAAYFYNAGVTVALGHSAADYETAERALNSYWTHITHAFNVHKGFHHRDPSIAGAILTSDVATAELIADLVHVHPGAMKLLIRCLGTDRIVLITDAMQATGLPDGEYTLLGEKVIVTDGKSTSIDGSIASSSAVLRDCVRNVRDVLDVSLPAAVKMASLNPASAINESQALGSIEVGKIANLIAFDDEINIKKTLINGKIVYSL